MRLYVGNLPYETTETQLREMAAVFGQPSTAEVAKDRVTGQPRGFGFVEFANDDEARAAVQGLNGKEINGRTLKVNEARSKNAAKF